MQLLTQIHTELGFRAISHLHELSLEDFIEWTKIEAEIFAIDQKKEDLEFQVELEEVDPDIAEMLEAEYNIDRYDLIYNQLCLIVHKEDIPKLKDKRVTRLDWYGLKTMVVMQYEDYQPNTVIIIPNANKVLIKDLENSLKDDIPKEDKIKRAEVQLRINRLKKNEFILLPVQDAIFFVKARTDKVRKQLPKLPELIKEAQSKEEEETLRKNLDLFIKKVEKELEDTQLDRSQKEVKERLKLRKMFKKWQSDTETAIYTLADQILTHLLIPVDEEYSNHYAMTRIEHIRKLKMDKVLPFINFIFAVLKSSNGSTAEFSETLKMKK